MNDEWQWYGQEARDHRQKVREAHSETILASLREFNITASKKVPEYIVISVINGLSYDGIRTVAEALVQNPSLAADLFPHLRIGNGFDWVPQVCSVYHLGLHENWERENRIAILISVLQSVDKLMRGPALYPHEWNGMALQQPWKSMRERVLQAWCAMEPDERMRAPLSLEVISLLSNENRDDYDSLLRIIRRHPTASVEQIEHILEGGSAVMAEGAL